VSPGCSIRPKTPTEWQRIASSTSTSFHLVCLHQFTVKFFCCLNSFKTSQNMSLCLWKSCRLSVCWLCLRLYHITFLLLRFYVCFSFVCVCYYIIFEVHSLALPFNPLESTGDHSATPNNMKLEGTGRGRSPPSSLLAVSNVTAHPSTASVPITVLLYNGLLLCGFNVLIKGLMLISLRVHTVATLGLGQSHRFWRPDLITKETNLDEVLSS